MVSPAWTPDGNYIVVSKSRPPEPGHVRAVHVSPRRRHRRARRPGAAAAARSRRARPAAGAADQQDGRGGVARRPLHLLHAAHRHVHLQRALPAVADLSSRHRDRRRHADHQRAGQRHPSGAFARRQVDGVRHAPQGADRPARPQSRDRRGAVARLSGDARRPGIARQPRHAAALRLHARRQVADRAGERQAAAHRLRHRRGHADSLHGEGGSRDRAARLHAGARGRRRHGARAADSLAVALAGRIEAGVQRDESALRPGLSEWHAATADCTRCTGRRRRAPAEGEFMPSWSPDGQSIVYATWTTTGGHIKRVARNRRSAANADAATKATTSTRRTRPMARASSSWPARRRISCIRS